MYYLWRDLTSRSCTGEGLLPDCLTFQEDADVLDAAVAGTPQKTARHVTALKGRRGILILIQGHLSSAPRPVKEATALAEAGHNVTVRGVWSSDVLAERDRALQAGQLWHFEPLLDFRPHGLHGRTVNALTRLCGRLARERFVRWGQATPDLLGYGARAAARAALSARADLTIVHSELGLWVGSVLRRRRLRVGVDFEDWFSEDLLPEARRTRPVRWLQALEGDLARACPYVLTTTNALADAISRAYEAPLPTVIYNAFPAADRPRAERMPHDRAQPGRPSLHWFSQTIGPGRGLELLFEALPLLRMQTEVHLRGRLADTDRAWFNTLVPPAWRDRVFVHDLVSSSALPARIAEHDVGLALDLPFCRSRDLTATNKLFQYLQAGLAVVATDTAGHREVMARTSGAGRLLSANEAPTLALAIDELVADPARLALAKQAAREAGDHLAWEHQAPILVACAERALDAPT